MTSFLCQIIVVDDDIWGWKNIYNEMRQFLKPNIVTPINNGDIEMVDLSAAPGQALYQCTTHHTPCLPEPGRTAQLCQVGQVEVGLVR